MQILGLTACKSQSRVGNMKDYLIPNRLRLKHLVMWNLRGNLATGLFDRFRIAKRWRLKREWDRQERRSGLECIVIAGGPSFTDKLARALIHSKRKIDVLALNYYCLSKHADELVPRGYVLSDPNTMTWKASEIKDYLSKHEIIVYSPYGAIWTDGIQRRTFFNDSENVYSNNIDPRYPRGYTSNTAFKAIAIALELGYDKVYIAGLDHDYPRRINVAEDRRLTLDNVHHYDKTREQPEVYPHFECIAHALHCYALNFWHLRKLRSPRVVNITSTSMVDTFERMREDDFIGYLADDRG